MIVYRKTFLGLHLLFRLYGSAILRSIIWGALAAAQTALLYAVADDYLTQYFYDGRITAYSILVSLVSLLVIFRQNASYGRFHEGRTRLQAMSAAWLDACVKALSFDGGDRHFRPPDAASRRFRLDCVHLFSLLHGIAVQFLRSDWMLDNLTEHDENKLPPWDSANSPTYSPSLVDYFVLRSVSHRRLRYNAATPVPVVGVLSALETAHLSLKVERTRTLTAADREDLKMGPQRRLTVIQSARHHLFASSQGKYVRGAAERVYTVYFWVHERCRQRITEGGLDMPAPILASLYTSLQRGMEAFEQCRYLCDTPFPFAWAQLLMVMLLVLQFTAPFVIVSSIPQKALGICLSAVAVQAYWSLNEVSRELEDPYCFEPNDIPLARLQYQFNERILAAANAVLPFSGQEGELRTSVEEAVHNAALGSLGAPDGAHTLDAELQVKDGRMEQVAEALPV